ncbi:hypothetical protein [uncultured Dubosiella sp.]|uniref:hypothetical protein n=1 Tax=uncultured Dubosiella sp. TaxID=1937011 RepID=UPI0020852959|nr:hypothetical protein [uncultured Dubosiella sp.]GJM58126.1 hypothetical protein EROP_18190 [Erysipelotrichaceae bacterium OPF54]
MLKDSEIMEIAEPLIEVLKKLESQLDTELMEVPTIRFMKNPDLKEFMIGDYTLDEESVRQIEEYIQEEIESMYHPTILH